MAYYVDTHCHLADNRFESDRGMLVSENLSAGVNILAVACDLESSRLSIGFAEKWKGVAAAVGVHPNDIGDLTDEDWKKIEIMAALEETAAVGETGLDYYWRKTDPELQKKWFRRHLELALGLGKPIVVHARESIIDCLNELEPFLRAGLKAVWHCFSAGRREYAQAIDFATREGVFIGVGGMATFPDQKTLREKVKLVPDRLLLLETDAPYLSPYPKVSQRNEPRGVVRVAEALAELRGVGIADIARITTRNACTLFGFTLPKEYAGQPITYQIRNSLYVALTMRCNNDCGFCPRKRSRVVKGYDLTYDRDPDLADVISELRDVKSYAEVVFCGLGEPTMRLEELKAAATEVKKQGVRVRVNTNGLAFLEHGRDVLPELAGLVDAFSVSLNTAFPKQYADICRPAFGDMAHASILEFVRRAVDNGFETLCTVVAAPGIDVKAAGELAQSLGAGFRIRQYDQLG